MNAQKGRGPGRIAAELQHGAPDRRLFLRAQASLRDGVFQLDGLENIGGQVFRGDHRAPAQHKGMLKNIVQFPDIARKRMFVQDLEHLGGKARRLPPNLFAVRADIQIRKEGNIFPAFAQRRNGNAHDIEPEKEVMPKLPVLHHFPQILVRRGHHAHPYAPCARNRAGHTPACPARAAA